MSRDIHPLTADENRRLSAMIAHVEVGDGAIMSVPIPNDNESIVWHLTWGRALFVAHIAASAIESYAYLLSDEINMTEATRRLRIMRNAVRQKRKS